MKYHFITKLHYLSLDTTLNRGKQLGGGLRLSNGQDNFKKMFDNRYFRDYAGGYQFQELEDAVYLYEVGEYSQLRERFAKEYTPSDYAFYCLRNAQYFVDSLWLVKDNSIYVRDGFLEVYPEGKPEQGETIFASVSAINSNTTGQIVDTTFSKEEIEKAAAYFVPASGFEGVEEGGKYPLKNPLTKDIGRLGRASYFCRVARATSQLPLKILNYCTVLECLFTSDSSEVTHKVAERLAYFLGADSTERRYYYHLAREAYRIRSKAIHGQAIRSTVEDMERISSGMDEAIRLIFLDCEEGKGHFKFFEIDDKNFEAEFNDLILS
jgi:hypothetical protein